MTTPDPDRRLYSPDGTGPTVKEYVEGHGLPYLAKLDMIAESPSHLVTITREWVEKFPAAVPDEADELEEADQVLEEVQAPAPTPTIAIPDRLKRDDLRFLMVKPAKKGAMEKAWPTSANYPHDNINLLAHLARGGNYGIFPKAGSSIVIFDADHLARLDELGALEGFPATFTIASGSSTPEHPKRHFFYELEGEPLDGKRPFHDPATAGTDGNLGHVFAQHAGSARGYVVGATSIHEDTHEPYIVLSDLPIAVLSREVWEHFERTVRWLSARTPAPTERAQARTAARGGTIGDLVGLTVTDIWPIPSTAERTGDNYLFPHPVHGSTKGEKGKNISVNPVLNKWKCFRCDSGGDALMALAVEERIIDCNEAHPGALDDPGRMKAVEEALRRRNYDVDEADRQRRATAPKRGRPPKAASSTAAGPTRPSPAPPAAEALPDELERFVYPLRSGALRVDDAIVGEYLYEKYHVISFNGVLYIYEAGMYRKNKGTLEAEIKRIVQGTGTHEQLTRVTREVLAHIAATAPFDTFPFNQAGDLIPVRNGVISIDYESETVALLPHDPKYRFLYQIPTVYDPEADRAPMRAVLGEYVEEEALDVLYEIPAVALLQMHGQQPYKRSYIVQGPANSAKSTYLLLLTELIGEDNVSSVSLQTITNDRFAFSDMESKILNIHDELKDIPLRDIGQFKKITGSYKHRIERKHETAYDGRITCPLVFSCNTPPSYPESEEFEDAWWIRWEYLNFVNVFPVDPTFRERVITPAVMSGFLNGVIDAMIYIHKHGLYREPDPGRVKESWKLASDLFKEFVAAEMVPVSGALENFKKGTLFAGFIQWCRDENKPTNRIPTDFKTFSPMVFRNEFVPRQIGPKTNREHVYAGPYKFKEGSKYAQPF